MKYSIFSLLIILTFLNLTFLGLEIKNPQDTTVPESAFAYNAFEICKGEKLYKNFNDFPFNIAPYTPLYYYFLSFSIKLLNLNAENIFYFGRAMNFFIILITSFIIYLILKKENISNFSTLFAILLLLSNFTLHPWAVTLRADLFSNLFSFLGFFFYKNFLFSLIFCTFSFYFKQSSIIFPISLFIFYLSNRNYKKAFAFFISYLILVSIPLFFINYQTKGLFFLNVFFANQAPMEIKNLVFVFGLFLQNSFLILSLGLFSLLNSKFNNLLSLYAIASLIFSLFFSLKLGSNTNYFIETLFLFSILSGRTTEEILKANKKVFFCIFLFPIIYYLIIITSTLNNKSFKKEDNIKAFILKKEKILITDNPRFSFLSKKPFLIDPFNLSYLEKKGKWSSEKIEEMFKKGEIIVVLTSPIEKPLKWQRQARLPEGIIKCIKENAYLYKIIDDYLVYLPKER